MSDETADAVLQIITQELGQGRMNYANVIPLLSLLCLNRILAVTPQNAVTAAPSAASAPLADAGNIDIASLIKQFSGGNGQNDLSSLLQQLTSGMSAPSGGGNDPQNMLMSMLPLLTGSSNKNKLSPQKLATLISMLSNLNNAAKPAPSNHSKSHEASSSINLDDAEPAASVTTPPANKESKEREYLNWKI